MRLRPGISVRGPAHGAASHWTVMASQRLLAIAEPGGLRCVEFKVPVRSAEGSTLADEQDDAKDFKETARPGVVASVPPTPHGELNYDAIETIIQKPGAFSR